MTSKVDLVVLTNFIPPTRYRTFKRVAEAVSVRFLIDTPTEGNRRWLVCHEGLAVEIVPGLHFRKSYQHQVGFEDIGFYHLPLGLLWRLYKLKPKYVWTGELGFRTAFACLYHLLVPSSRLVCAVGGTRHTDACRGWFRVVWRRLLLRSVDCVCAFSRGAQDLVHAYGFPEDRVRVAYMASRFGPPEAVPVRDVRQRKRLLYSGQFAARKGIRPFLNALIAVCDRHPEVECEIRFVGYGPEEPWIRSVHPPANLNIDVFPPVELEQMPSVLADCGILAFPTLADIWGLVTNEAMAYSMPVLGSVYAQSVCDLVEEGVTGWKFHPDNQDEMECTIEAALSATPERLEAMGAAAREAVRSLTPENFADEMLRVIFEPSAKGARG